jgi:hypothetical protein
VNARWSAVPLALAMEVTSATQFLMGDPDLQIVTSAVAWHAAACILFGWASIAGSETRAQRSRQLLSGAVAFLVFPVFGMLAIVSGWLAAMVVARWSGRPVDDVNRERPSIIYTDLWPIDPLASLEVEPLVDLLNGRDADLKRGAIEALVSRQGHRAAGVLQRLLHDNDPEIRLYASIRLCTLEDDVARAIQEANTATVIGAADPAGWQRLAQAHIDYASSGLLDVATTVQNLDLAEAAFASASGLQPGQHELSLALGQTWLQLGRLDTAREHLECAIQAHRPRVVTNARIGLMEAAFRGGSWSDVVQQAVEANRTMPARHPHRGVVEWWAAA